MLLQVLPTGAGIGSLADATGFWLWLERLSWIFTIIGVLGIIAAVVSLSVQVREQQRIHRDLVKQPKIILGFQEGANPSATPPVLPATCEVRPVWSGQNALSEPLDLTILLLNSGQRTGHHLLVNVVFPPGVEITLGERQIGTLHVQSIRDPGGNARFVFKEEVLHPGVVDSVSVPLRIPRGTPGFPGSAIVNVDDTEQVKTNLRVTVRNEEPAGR